jgi:hypothetical protein
MLCGARPSKIRKVLMKMLRRALVALGIAAAIAAVLRVRGTGGVPPQGGGWQELTDSDPS